MKTFLTVSMYIDENSYGFTLTVTGLLSGHDTVLKSHTFSSYLGCFDAMMTCLKSVKGMTVEQIADYFRLNY